MATVPKIIGRGGAGNFRDPTTADQATAGETPTTPDTRTVTSHLSSIRSGRGGAGNINTSTSSSTSPATSSNPSSTSGPNTGNGSQTARPPARQDGLIVEAPKSAPAEVVYGGRGGAGNWKVGREEEEERRKGVEEERRRGVEEEVRRVVEGGLVVPGRVYRGVRRGGGEEDL
ncbi:hypothetical protein VE03_08434 [Pseudogymnoascus sp. 23342-1-I1]|nr:hypothetical protein VE03_08434 [Pseudogymnoascus sp. 23342-1-I1]